MPCTGGDSDPACHLGSPVSPLSDSKSPQVGDHPPAAAGAVAAAAPGPAQPPLLAVPDPGYPADSILDSYHGEFLGGPSVAQEVPGDPTGADVAVPPP